jgi:hypothetical protein
MKNRNPIFIAIVFALAFALAPVTKAVPNPGGIPTIQPVNNEQASPEGENRPVITIHSAGNILRGKTGSFVLEMKPALAFGGMYVNFKVGGTAVAGVDYVSLISPTYIGQSGFGALLLKTLPDPRASSGAHAYTVVVTLEPGAGYAVGKPSSAKILISTSCALEACW